MPKIRVLVVDDAAVFRRLVADELSSDPALEVVGTAPNGRIALAKLAQVNPDVVILDLEMPEMDGLATLAELRKTHPRLPVIMFSAMTERGANATLDALALGATDYFTKPANVGGLDGSLQVIREQLIPEIKALCAAAQARASALPLQNAMDRRWLNQGADAPRSPRRDASHPPWEETEEARDEKPLKTQNSKLKTQNSKLPTAPQVVAIGASTGGPNALAEIFQRLPSDFPVPILIVQHMPPMFTRLLAERLSAEASIRVQEAVSGSLLLPGQAWIAPGDHHMIVVRDGAQVRLLTHQDSPENSCRPAVDVLLRSVAHTYGPNSLAVILSGMGQDGLRGCELLREQGAQILAQDESSSVVWGMPGHVARAGLTDRVLPLSLIADEILRRTRLARVA